MNERAQLIKTAISQELEKAGMTLADLEQELTKSAGDKGGLNLLISPEKLLSVIPALGNLGAATGGAAAAVGGGGMYGAYLMNEDSNNKILKKMKERQQYLNATRSLKEDMANPLTL